MSNTGLVQLRIRMIALENVITTLLAGTSDKRLDLVGEMAGFITPRPGFTQHPLTARGDRGGPSCRVGGAFPVMTSNAAVSALTDRILACRR